jgi:hypothetical protein
MAEVCQPTVTGHRARNGRTHLPLGVSWRDGLRG